MYSASAKNNMAFINNIGAYRQAAKDKWIPVWRGGGEKLKEHNEETKKERDGSQ